MKRRTFSLAAGATALGALGLSACGGTNEAERGPGDEVIVTFWHSMRGNNAEQLESYVEEFNDSQDEILVQASFQGMYDEAQTKLMQLLGTDDAPTIQQLPGTSSRELVDSGAIAPMQDFIDENGFDLEALQPNIVEAYTVDGVLYAMPQAASGPLLFYNRELFEEAGLDPDSPPATFSEVREVAQTLVDSGLVENGLALRTDGGALTELLSNQGELLYDNDNGRSAPAENAVFNSERGVEVMTWIADLHEDGLVGNFGRTHDDMRTPWYAQDVAMVLDTSAATIIHHDTAEFEVGAGYVPAPDDATPTGPAVGGAGLWILADAPEEAQAAAFTFVTHLLEPRVQARWAANTGYFPITTASYEESELTEQMESVTGIRVANEQVSDTETNPATLGVLAGVQPEPYVADAWERIYDGSDPQQELDAAAEEITQALGAYNDANV